MKCAMCDQIMQMREPRADHPTGNRLVCINNRCPDYFEPAARHPDAEPARGHGIKLDTGKVPVFTEFLMQFPDAIELVAWIGEKGSKAPGHVRSGWKSVEDGYMRYSDAFGRHILEEARRLTVTEPDSPDPDFDLLFQIATVAWNSMARLQLYAKQNPGVVVRAIGERVDSAREA